MKTIYTNLYNKEITVQQIQSNSKYYKVLKNDDNKLIKTEFYDNNNLKHTYFYLDFESSHQDILTLNHNKSFSIIEIEVINENYFKHFGFEYLNGIIKKKDLSIYDSNEYCLMIQDITIDTNLPMYNETCKFYNDSSGYQFEFNYFKSGELSSIFVSNKTLRFYQPYRTDELNMIPNFEWWDQYSSYYLNAEPAVPNGIIIV